MLDFIAFPMGSILKGVYETIGFQNYGVSIILFTLIVKTCLLPFYIKQYKSSAEMSAIQPEISRVQKQYAGDKERLNEELMKVYRDHKVNPANGCLPMLIQMPILFTLYYVISQPIKYMRIESQNIVLNMNFFGINLASIPTWKMSHLISANHLNADNVILLLIPILATVTTYMSTKASLNQTGIGSTDPMQEAMQKNMLLISPIMTGFISFSVPAGMGLYWIVSNVFQLVQQLLLIKIGGAKEEGKTGVVLPE